MNNIKPSAGKLLLSDPFMLDPNFKRSVVLLCEHQEEGTLGFILNKSMKLSLEEVIDDIENFDAKLYYGGPVQLETLHFFHDLGEAIEGSIEVLKGVWWGGNFEEVKSLINQNVVSPDNFRFFLGYSGWSAGQLDNEIKEHSWIIASATDKDIFHAKPENLWKMVLQRLGGNYKLMSNFPENPSWN